MGQSGVLSADQKPRACLQCADDLCGAGRPGEYGAEDNSVSCRMGRAKSRPAGARCKIRDQQKIIAEGCEGLQSHAATCKTDAEGWIGWVLVNISKRIFPILIRSRVGFPSGRALVALHVQALDLPPSFRPSAGHCWPRPSVHLANGIEYARHCDWIKK